MLSHRAKNCENLVCVNFFVFRGRGRADPRRQDQLVLMGCANAKIMKPWFEPNISLFLGRVGADPRRQDQVVPMGCAKTKIVKPWFEPSVSLFRGRVRADPRRKDQLVPMGCAPERKLLGRVRAGPRRQDQLVPLSCAHAKIMSPWFVPSVFPGGRVRADPRGMIRFVVF